MLEFIFGKPSYPQYCNHCGAKVIDTSLYINSVKYSTETGQPYTKIAPYKICEYIWDIYYEKVRKAARDNDYHYDLHPHYMQKVGKGKVQYI